VDPSSIKKNTWTERLYKLIREEEIDEATDMIFERIEDLLLMERFGECNKVIKSLNLELLDTNIIVAVLGVTHLAKSHLPYRAKFTEAAIARLTKLAPDRVERLISGLC